MILSLVALLLFANVVFAQAQTLLQNEFSPAPIQSGPMTHMSSDSEGSPVASMSSLRSDGDPWPKRTYAPAPVFGDVSQQQKFAQWPDAGGFVDGVIANAFAVKRFITTYSSYDSGANQYSRPAVHINPHVQRGSARVSAQLRF